MSENDVFGLPLLGGSAPEFEATTTQGTLRLSDYKGSWLVIFSHPADFTPVCTTEFIAFAQIHDELTGRNLHRRVFLGSKQDRVFPDEGHVVQPRGSSRP